MACEAIRVEVNRGADWIVDADLTNCFGSISHDALMTRLERRVSNRDMLKLLRSWLRVGVLENGVVTDTTAGTPQGSPVSALLPNIALHVLDEAWQRDGNRLGALVRYADDLVVICPTRARAEAAQRPVSDILAPLGLRLNPDKTRTAHLTRGVERFEFLGFHHHKVESFRWPGHWNLQRWSSKRAMKWIRAKVRAATEPRFGGTSWDIVVAPLRQSARKFDDIDIYVHERLAILASREHGRPGWNLGHLNWEWLRSLNVYRLQGTHTMGDTACLAMNDVGKPCAGELHARFERGPLAKRTDRADKGEKGRSPAPDARHERPAAYLTS